MPKRPITPEDLLRLQFVGDPQIHPDGGLVLFTKKHIDADKNKYVTNLFTVDLDGGVRQWTQGEGGAGHGRWSPDGRKIAFISGREDKKDQLFLLDTAGGEAQKLSNLPEGSIGGFEWSPDGTKIAFTFRETAEQWTSKAKKERDEKGLSVPPRVIETAWYRLDGDGYFEQQRYKLYVLDVATGEHRLLYEGCALGGYSFDWSPASDELIVAHNVAKNPFAERPNDGLFRVDLRGQAWELQSLGRCSKGSPKWSPDGKTIAYLGQEPDAEDWGARNVRLYVAPAEGGAPSCLSGEDDYCMTAMGLSDTRDAYGYSAVTWSPDSKALYVSIGWHGATQLGFVQIDRARVELLTEGQHTIAIGSLSRNGERFAIAHGTATKMAEIGVLDLASLDRPNVLTKFNQPFHDEVKLSEPEEFWVEASDGAKVHGWVMKPVGYLEPKRYPAVLEIHGGPHAQYGWAFFHEFQVLAAAGYVVVYSNPRGSKGYGEAHCAAIKGAWGDRDWEDVQAVTRWMQHQPYIHPGSMGVMGGSYGGYMTNWVVGHTKDFRAAITDRCVSNLVSMGGSSDFPFNPQGGYWPGRPYGPLEEIAGLWKQSPMASFDKVTTPMLIIHSEGDLRCNIEQGEQVFSALQVMGVDSRFVRYPATTSHGLSRGGPPDLRLHRLGEIVAWWKKYLG